MRRGFKSKKRYLFAFIIGTLVFGMIFLLSYSVSYFELNRVSGLQTDVAYRIFEDKFYYSFFNEDSCVISPLDDLSNDLNFQRSIIDNLESRLGKNNVDVLARKKFYTLIELEHFEFVQDLNERCNLDIPTILFFYSNEEELIEESLLGGRILENVVEQTDGLIVYSFDFNLDSKLINSLKYEYNISEPLTILVNEKVKIVEPDNINDILEVLED